jgi:hypothetical protein
MYLFPLINSEPNDGFKLNFARISCRYNPSSICHFQTPATIKTNMTDLANYEVRETKELFYIGF